MVSASGLQVDHNICEEKIPPMCLVSGPAGHLRRAIFAGLVGVGHLEGSRGRGGVGQQRCTTGGSVTGGICTAIC